METKLAVNLIRKTFSFPFKEENFKEVIIESLNGFEPYEEKINITNLPSNILEKTEAIKTIGRYNDENGEGVFVVIVILKEKRFLEQTRNIQREIASKIMNTTGFDNILAAFVAMEYDNWRYSLIQRRYGREKTESGKYAIKTEITELKRQSYLVGKDEPNHTAQKQMLPLLESSEPPILEDINKVFSIENLKDEFFIKYRDLVYRLEDELKKIKETTPNVRKTFEKNFITEDVFAKKLMGQIVFLYFVQKKGWLGIKKDQEWGEGPTDFMSRLWNKEYCEYDNFFDDVLEPLFYDGLARENKDDFYSPLDCKIPFLNGGLFEPINDYSWDESNITLSNDLIKNIFDTFNLFNFTIEEHQPLDVNVAIDPEMLGKVFEKLLGTKDRKSLGTFYTPREIVEYMCQEGLIGYLQNRFSDEVGKNSIELLINESELDNNIKKKAKEIDKYLSNIKICDPSIGSGGFAVTLLNKIVNVRQLLGESLNLERTLHELKMNCIQNNIYGVDLDPSAVDIAKLRLWLSLVVDENDYSSIHALPNLTFKIMQGDSLLEYFRGISLNIKKKEGEQLTLSLNVDPLDKLIEGLHLRQNEFFQASALKDIKIAKKNVEDEMIKIFRCAVDEDHFLSDEKRNEIEKDLHSLTHGNKARNFFPWELYFADVFRYKKGFDIVIGNPPYRQLRKNKGELAVKYKDSEYKTFSRDSDMYVLFYEKGINLLREGGELIFISSNKWLKSSYGQLLREHILKYNPKFLIDLGDGIFEAIVDTAIVLIEKSENKNSLKAIKQEYLEKLNDIVEDDWKVLKDLNHEPWFIGEESELILKRRLDTIGIELGKLDLKIKNGVKTGLSKAFFVSHGERKTIVENDIKSEEIIVPLIKGRNIKKYFYKSSNEFLLKTDYDLDILKLYPAISKHLEQFKEDLLKRGDGSKGKNWYNIRQCSYYNEFDKEKIVWPEIAQEHAFALLPSGFYINNTANFITTKDIVDLKCLLGILNSNLSKWYLTRATTDLGKKGRRYFKKFLVKFPIPKYRKNSHFVNNMINLIDTVCKIKQQNPNSDISDYESEINHLVNKLYNLNDNEIKIINSS